MSQSPTLARTGTAAGVILGTAAYMSPEQARGKPVDKRADIWAFGVLLFEMLTGKRLFGGETVSDVLAAVLTREPRWNELPAATPPSVRRLLRRCLERNPRNRQHDIADVRVALDEAIAGATEEGQAALAPAAGRPRWHDPTAGSRRRPDRRGRFALGDVAPGAGARAGRPPERRAGSGRHAGDGGVRDGDGRDRVSGRQPARLRGADGRGRGFAALREAPRVARGFPAVGHRQRPQPVLLARRELHRVLRRTASSRRSPSPAAPPSLSATPRTTVAGVERGRDDHLRAPGSSRAPAGIRCRRDAGGPDDSRSRGGGGHASVAARAARRPRRALHGPQRRGRLRRCDDRRAAAAHRPAKRLAAWRIPRPLSRERSRCLHARRQALRRTLRPRPSRTRRPASAGAGRGRRRSGLRGGAFRRFGPRDAGVPAGPSVGEAVGSCGWTRRERPSHCGRCPTHTSASASPRTARSSPSTSRRVGSATCGSTSGSATRCPA